MSDERVQSIEEAMEGKTKKAVTRHGWVGFVESDVVNFMLQHNIEKMTLDDGAGNKAKLTRLRDSSVKVECTSANIL